MGTGYRRAMTRGRLVLLSSVAAIAFLAVAGAGSVAHVHAQDIDFDTSVSPSAEMLLEADTLVYDNDRNTVSAIGGVRIDYDGQRLVADRVVYDRNTSRMVAMGGVELVDRDGNRIYSEHIDITDDFRDGFVQSLWVHTADDTYFAAEQAERRDGAVTTFQRGTYTACEPCQDNPDKPQLWRIRSQQIIWDGEARTIRFRHARLEFFGLPIAYLPVFEIPDPTVRRKSGFLAPTLEFRSEEIGTGFSLPYYFALSPTYDLTVTGSYLSRQGFLGRAEWRQRFNSGQYNIRVAGISQRGREHFPGSEGDSRVNRNVTGRAMISTKGDFRINPRWTFGWDAMYQTDKNFARTYQIPGNAGNIRTSQAYLTGLNDRNYFDLRAMHFRVQEDRFSFNDNSRSRMQPWVLPSFDYSFTPDEPVAGGELNLTVNAQSLHRRRIDRGRWRVDDDLEELVPDPDAPDATIRGAEGNFSRVTAEAEWKRSLYTGMGLVVTPLLHARGDAIMTSFRGESFDNINLLAAQKGVSADIRSAYYRYMATAGLELRWPVLFSTTSSSHILEPMAQVFVRPNEPFGDSLGIPNEDAQSLVFDAATLFERDKFSGFDRIEGGTRANLGLRYLGDFGGGWTANAIFGQSIHIAGRNPYASPDLVHAGAFSGLQTRRSDYVGQIGVGTPIGLNVAVGARFDQATFRQRRTDLTASYSRANFSLAGQYSYIAAQPDYGFSNDRHEVTLAGRTRLAEHWSAFASGTYDFETSTLVRRSIGFAYDDECFEFRLSMTERKNPRNNELRRNFGVQFTLRTLGTVGTDSGSLMR